MTTPHENERGSAMVLAIGALAVLAVIALVVISVVVSEKRSTSSQYAHDRAFYSADAAGEAGVHWIRQQLSPPPLADTLNHVRPSTGPIVLTDDHHYAYDVTYVTKQFRPGWSVEYKDFVYRVEASGTSAQQSEAGLQVNATRLYREGY